MPTLTHENKDMHSETYTPKQTHKTESCETHKEGHKYMHKLNYKYTQGDTHRQKQIHRELLILMDLCSYTKID